MLSIFSCKEKSIGSSQVKYLNTFSDQIICWEGVFYLHAIFSIVTSLIFILICFIVKKTCFETKNSSHNLSAKINSNSDIILLIEKALIVTIFTFGKDIENQWLLIAIIFLASGTVFFSFLINSPFYNKFISKVKLRNFIN